MYAKIDVIELILPFHHVRKSILKIDTISTMSKLVFLPSFSPSSFSSSYYMHINVCSNYKYMYTILCHPDPKVRVAQLLLFYTHIRTSGQRRALAHKMT